MALIVVWCSWWALVYESSTDIDFGGMVRGCYASLRVDRFVGGNDPPRRKRELMQWHPGVGFRFIVWITGNYKPPSAEKGRRTPYTVFEDKALIGVCHICKCLCSDL